MKIRGWNGNHLSFAIYDSCLFYPMIHDSFTFFSPEIHDSLFYVSASTPVWKYPDLDFTAALELLAGYRPHITL